MNKTDSAKNMLIDTIDSLVREKYGDSYGDGEPFSRLCPAIYELDRKDLQRIANLLCNKPYAETPEIGKMEIMSLMCAVEATAGMSKDKVMVKRALDLAEGMNKTPLIKTLKVSYSEFLASKKTDSKTHDETEKNKDGAGKNKPSPKGREQSVQTEHSIGRNTEKTGRKTGRLGR